ncbi:MAG TPA: ABC transporter permease, partial [Roseiarcus sp.]|nr:ABC transporter permease [Roseiarcus sp.]
MSDLPDAASRLPSLSGLAVVAFLRTHSIVVLLLLLAAFILAIEIARPGTVNPTWASNIVMFAAPLGIMAAGQTLVMLTGGIDLSVASVATSSAYLMATHTAFGGSPAVSIGLAAGLAVGLINGLGIALLGVQPLIMTLGTGLMTEGALVVYSQTRIGDGPHAPQFINALGAGKVLEVIPNDLFLRALIAIATIFILRRTG